MRDLLFRLIKIKAFCRSYLRMQSSMSDLSEFRTEENPIDTLAALGADLSLYFYIWCQWLSDSMWNGFCCSIIVSSLHSQCISTKVFVTVVAVVHPSNLQLWNCCWWLSTWRTLPWTSDQFQVSSLWKKCQSCVFVNGNHTWCLQIVNVKLTRHYFAF